MLLSVNDIVLMRTLTTDDASEIYKVIDKNRVYLRKWLPWVDNTDSEDVVLNVINKWITQQENGNDLVFGIYKAGLYIGNIGLHNIDMENKKAIIGYWLSEDNQGSGIMTNCVQTLINYAFTIIELNTIDIHCALQNSKSRAIPERLDFTQTGILKDGENLYGITYDLIIYSFYRLS